MNDLNKDIKIVEEMINEAQCEALSYDTYCYEIKVQQVEAISNLLSRLKTAERMNDVLAEKLVGRINESEYCDSNIFSCFAKKEKSCKQCIKE